MAAKNPGTLAILIDGDNASQKYIVGILAEVANYGVASVKRVYGDWTKPNLNGWKEQLLEHSLQPVQQFAYTSGKNATDGAMIIDAMDLLYTGRFSGFCIVSSDSDFARLAARLREQGATVYGFGEGKTPRPFITACDRFVYLEALDVGTSKDDTPLPASDKSAPGEPALKTPTKPSLELDQAALKLLRTAVTASADEDGWAHLGQVGSHLAKQSAAFDSRNYGFARLSDLAKASAILEVKRADDQNKAFMVKLHPAKAKR